MARRLTLNMTPSAFDNKWIKANNFRDLLAFVQAKLRRNLLKLSLAGGQSAKEFSDRLQMRGF